MGRYIYMKRNGRYRAEKWAGLGNLVLRVAVAMTYLSFTIFVLWGGIRIPDPALGELLIGLNIIGAGLLALGFFTRLTAAVLLGELLLSGFILGFGMVMGNLICMGALFAILFLEPGIYSLDHRLGLE
jgi:uncharacterized membrane protein YphA (DoxX/SURF4 family)